MHLQQEPGWASSSRRLGCFHGSSESPGAAAGKGFLAFSMMIAPRCAAGGRTRGMSYAKEDSGNVMVNKLPSKMKDKLMKYLPLIILTLGAAFFGGCDEQRAAIEDKKEATKDAIDNRKTAVDTAAKEAKKQTDIDASVEKAKIEATKDATQAQLDADKKKADAQATLEKAKLDAEKK